MGVFRKWIKDTLATTDPVRVAGRPPSLNGASSMHAHWMGVRPGAVGCSVDLTVTDRPSTPDLHFWALQASFVDSGRLLGAGHLGLQHYPAHPRSCAVNWGGYHSGGGELSGSASELPSRPGNANTRDYSWDEGVSYRLEIARSTSGWSGSVTDLASGRQSLVRELFAAAPELTSMMVWSEVFAACDAPSCAVSWTNLQYLDRDGAKHRPESVSLTYQTHADGGCTNTSTEVTNGGVTQQTATTRSHRHGTVLTLLH